ncbi:MAG: Gfo/Idh/MocA family oxidoreductase [Pirellulales bacterium]
MPYTWTSNAQETTAPRSANDRWRIGAIGMRYQGSVITREAMSFGDVVAICDVDRHVREQARASFNSQAAIYENYNDLIQRKDIDVVLIGTPDHWHAKMVIDACRAGKDVYVEKPLTLTIDEGKIIQRIAKETGRVIQVGSWQRSDARFRLAVEMVQAGRIGTLQRVFVVMGKNSTGGPFSPQPVPKHFNWDLWQGQTPDVPYIPEPQPLHLPLVV